MSQILWPIVFMNSDSSHLEYSFAVLPGVILAGAAYPTLLLLFGQVFAPWNNDPFILLFAICVAGLIGLLLAGLSGLLSALLINAINWSLNYPMSPYVLVSCVGGLAGFTPKAAFGLSSNSLTGLDLVWVVLVGPVLATLVGQTGAQLWEKRKQTWPKRDYRQKLCLKREGEAPETDYAHPPEFDHTHSPEPDHGHPPEPDYELPCEPKPKLRFELKQVFVITFWFAILLTLDKAELHFELTLLFLIWIALQSLLIYFSIGASKLWNQYQKTALEDYESSV